MDIGEQRPQLKAEGLADYLAYLGGEGADYSEMVEQLRAAVLRKQSEEQQRRDQQLQEASKRKEEKAAESQEHSQEPAGEQASACNTQRESHR